MRVNDISDLARKGYPYFLIRSTRNLSHAIQSLAGAAPLYPDHRRFGNRCDRLRGVETDPRQREALPGREADHRREGPIGGGELLRGGRQDVRRRGGEGERRVHRLLE